jgi:hypothetical protein
VYLAYTQPKQTAFNDCLPYKSLFILDLRDSEPSTGHTSWPWRGPFAQAACSPSGERFVSIGQRHLPVGSAGSSSPHLRDLHRQVIFHT